MTQLQEPVLKKVRLEKFVSNLKVLYPTVKWEVQIPEDVLVEADEMLLRQVFVNIIKNAIEAQAKHLNITWQAPSLHISNDGTPILPEVRRDIFVPFYTTKSTGTGIGLALSRQIMTMQGCALRLAEKSDAGNHVTFVLDFQLS